MSPPEKSTLDATWIFGYGSLIWRPDIEFVRASPATLHGFYRRFWQGSHDHRGTPEQPGRVVTLIADNRAMCRGMAYLVANEVIAETFEKLDHREKNGYTRHAVKLDIDDNGEQLSQGLVYVAQPNNFAYLGSADNLAIAKQILHSSGPSGRNIDYLNELANALRAIDAVDEHVFELEALAAQLAQTSLKNLDQ